MQLWGATAVSASRDNMAALYRDLAPDAARLAYLLTGDRDLAEDLVQEAFLKMLGRFEHLRKPASFQAYLNRTIVNLSKKQWRRRDVERRYIDRESATTSTDRNEAPDLPMKEALWVALQALPHRQRTAIVLRFYEDLSEHETAQLLDCSTKAVRSLVGRAKDALRGMTEGVAP